MVINKTIFNAELYDILEELRNQLHINGIQLLEKEPKRSGNSLQIQCPYHNEGQERQSSAGIRMSDGKFHCFACGEVHELYEVVSHCFGYYDDVLGKFGWQWLLKNFATLNIAERRNITLDFGRQNKSVKEQKNYVTEEELSKYRYYHPYMYKRGLTDEIIELFDIGYDKSSKCITFPVRDVDGNCLFVARRSVNTKWFNYPKGVEKPLYGLYELHHVLGSEINPLWSYHQFMKGDAKEIIVCESMLDALSFWVVGKYAVALNGIGDELQFNQLRSLPCRKLILATDMDNKGLKARKTIRKNIPNKIVTEYLFPEGRKDANECTPEELKTLLEVF